MWFTGFRAPRIVAIACVVAAAASVAVGVTFAMALWPDQSAVNAVAEPGETAPPALYLPAWAALLSGLGGACGWLAGAVLYAWMAAMFRQVTRVAGPSMMPGAAAPTQVPTYR